MIKGSVLSNSDIAEPFAVNKYIGNTCLVC